jgi:hypothetical protein
VSINIALETQLLRRCCFLCAISQFWVDVAVELFFIADASGTLSMRWAKKTKKNLHAVESIPGRKK